MFQWIALRENLQENPMIFMETSMVFPWFSGRFSLKPIHFRIPLEVSAMPETCHICNCSWTWSSDTRQVAMMSTRALCCPQL